MLTPDDSLDAVVAVDAPHPDGVGQDEQEENVDRPLLGEPKSEREAGEMNLVEVFDEDVSQPDGHGEPDTQQDCDEAQIGSPIPAVAF